MRKKADTTRLDQDEIRTIAILTRDGRTAKCIEGYCGIPEVDVEEAQRIIRLADLARVPTRKARKA